MLQTALLSIFRFSVGRRRATCAVVVAVTCAALVGLVRLRIEEDPYAAVRATNPDYRRLEEISLAYGLDDEGIVIVLEADEFFTFRRVTALRRLLEQLQTRPEVTGTYSLLDGRRPGPGRLQLPLFPETLQEDDLTRARDAAAASSLIRGQLLSDDGRMSLALVRLTPQARDDVARLESLLEYLRQTSHTTLDDVGIRARFTGVPVIRVELVRATQRNVVYTTALACGAALLISLVILRDWRAVLTAAVPPAFASLWILGFLGLAGIAVNVLSATVSTLVLVIGLSDSIHLSQDIWRRRRAGEPIESASLAALLHSGTACGITALTTALGFASLALTDSPVVRQYGMILAAGALAAFAATVLLVPLLAGHFPTYRAADAEHAVSRWIEAGTRRIVEASLAHRKAICVGCFLGFLLTGWAVFQLRPDTSLTENLPRDSAGSAALRDCDRAFGGVFHTVAVVHWPEHERLDSPATEAAVRALHEVLRRQPALNHPLSLVSVVESMPNLGRNWPEIIGVLTSRPRDSLQRFFQIPRREALVTAHTPEIGSAAMDDVIRDLQGQLRHLEAAHPGFRFELSGTPVVATRLVNQLLVDLGAGLGIEAVMILLLISYLFRSLKLGLVSLVPNLFPLACLAAVMALVDMPLHFGSVIVFNICLGLAVDDTVHLVSRIAEAHGEPTAEGMIRSGIDGVGTAIVATTLILCAGFGVQLVSEMYASRVFGGLSCVTLGAAFLAELVLLPALLAVFGRAALERRRTVAAGRSR